MRRLFAFFFLCISLSALAPGCSTNCDDLQTEASRLKDELGRCSAGDTCVTVNVENDCLSGALVCGFAVPAAQAENARTQAQAIADKSLNCNPCPQAECANHGAPTCDANAGRCVFAGP